MAKTKAAAVMRAAEKAQSADRRVGEARRALIKAERACERAEAQYLKLVSESVSGPRGAREEPQEVQHAG